MKQIQKKSQIGRSMTEMLGVLAIIGVLSVAAVSGYRTAITRHKTNDLIEDVKLAGFLVTADDMIKNLPEFDAQENGPALNLQGKFTPKTSYDFWVFKESPETYAIVALDVKENVCREAVTRKTDWLEEIRANGTENKCHDANDNDMSFFFNTALNGQQTDFFGACEEDAECGECGKCNGRKCEYETGELKTSAGKCVPCTGSKTSSTTTQQACSICPQDTRFYSTTDGKCYTCDITGGAYGISATKAECLRCSNRYWTGSCFVCTGRVINNGTACEWDCPPGYVGTETGCQPCQSGTITYRTSTLNSCRGCSNRFYAHAHFNEYGGFCYLCSNLQGEGRYTNWVKKEDCMKCPNTYWRAINGGGCYYCSGTVSADGLSCIKE